MKFITIREQLLKPLQQVSNLLSGKPIIPILSNILLKINKDILYIISTDLEIEIIAKIKINKIYKPGETAINGKKITNILKRLPKKSEIYINITKEKFIIKSNKSEFSLSTVSTQNFPYTKNFNHKIEFTISESKLKYLIESTQFSMAQQDVRYYLNGMFFQIYEKKLISVATDGHRLAKCSLIVNQNLPNFSIIIPRKGILEFIKLLNKENKLIKLQINKQNIRVYIDNIVFTSKLIDGCFPNYQKVLPKNADKLLIVNCNELKEALLRASILSNEKFKGVKFHISNNKLKIISNNQEQETSIETIDVNFNNSNIEICFNINYILDILNILKCEIVHIFITDEISSVKIIDINNKLSTYIVMPMRL